uniref:C-type lectin domain-containing protein n=1 Tax=Oryzias latipes TaxID=8090 RepID=A0A3P9L0M8_ORYLA
FCPCKYLSVEKIFILSHCLVIRQYHLVTTPLNWTDAQTYCRKNYIDLATIESSKEQETFGIANPFQEKKDVFFQALWIGLQNEINWRWSDGDQICLTTSRTNRLLDFDCSSLFPFICYNGKNFDKIHFI